MINKILRIKNIGIFKDLRSANDDLSFKKYTLILGPNKHGKTTLTAIFKSLKTTGTSHLVGRKTLGAKVNEKQEYEILMSDNSHSTYNLPLQNVNMEIFDNEFINRNVFSGDNIDKSNKCNLYSILLDEKNIELKKEIDILEAKQENITREKKYAKSVIKDFDQFIKLEKADEIQDIDNKIEENNNKIKQYNNQVELNLLCKRSKFNFDFSVFETSLKKTIDNTLEDKINEHIKNNLKNETDGKNFLEKGLGLILDKNTCPFCGQSLKEVADYIKTLKTFFGTTYKEVQQNINNAVESFTEIDVQKEISGFKNYGLEFPHLDVGNLSDVFIKIENKIKEKQRDLLKNIEIDKDQDYMQFKKEVLSIKGGLDNLTAAPLNKAQLETEALKFKLNKERFSVEGIKKFNLYKVKEKEFEENKKEIQGKTQKLKRELNLLFSQHLTEINEVLQKSWANFKLKRLEPNTNRSLRDHMCEYSFVFDGAHEVDIEGEENKPSFKNTLSDSDKRVLAFAFFIAKIKAEDNLATKIVVLDDPFTSLDEDRKDSMITLIKDLQCEQIIILSHNKRFIGRCFELMSKSEINTLRLHSTNANGSVLEYIDVQREILDSEIEKDLHYIREAIKVNRNIGEACKKVRPCIERLLKAKYSDFIKPENLTGSASISKFLNDIGTNCPVKKEIEESNWHDDHHAQNPMNISEDAEKYNKLKYFIENILIKI